LALGKKPFMSSTKKKYKDFAELSGKMKDYSADMCMDYTF
jgi:hypothetical protein